MFVNVRYNSLQPGYIFAFIETIVERWNNLTRNEVQTLTDKHDAVIGHWLSTANSCFVKFGPGTGIGFYIFGNSNPVYF